MRKVNALSYSGFQLWSNDPEAFYMRFLSEAKTPREPQSLPAAIGGAFDAIVKTELQSALRLDHFRFGDLFENQVEPQCRDAALEHGKYLLESYKTSGAYTDLLNILRYSSHIAMDVSYTRRVCGVKLTGQPDLSFEYHGINYILDWKVRSFLSQCSPTPGYVICRDGYSDGRKATRFNGQPHGKAKLIDNFDPRTSEEFTTEYADQITIYQWLLGIDTIAWVDELCSKGNKRIRVATHRGLITNKQELLSKLQTLWQHVQTNTVIPLERQKILDKAARYAA
jgi:hypothetical protein